MTAARRAFHWTLAAETEDLIAALAAIGIIFLPLAEVVLRRFFNTGVPGAAPFT